MVYRLFLRIGFLASPGLLGLLSTPCSAVYGSGQCFEDLLKTIAPSSDEATSIEEKKELKLMAAIIHKRDPHFYEKLDSALYGKDAIQRIYSHLNALKELHLKAQTDPALFSALKEKYAEAFVIKPDEVPENYFKLQQKIALERGYGHIEYTPEIKSQEINTLINDQKSSLNAWLDYLNSRDADYPFANKYWTTSSMTKLKPYDFEAGLFPLRSKGTTAPFPELNQEALGTVMQEFSKQVRQPGFNLNQDLKKIDFATLYGNEIQKLKALEIERLKSQKTVEGVWIKYPKGSDHTPLFESLQGKSTGWCTAGAEATCKTHVANGDFHVFYTFDQNGKATNPRVAIRMEGDKIAEVRGVGSQQNIDPVIAETDVVKNKLKEFGSEGDRYTKRDADMKRVTYLAKLKEQGKEFSKVDLHFIYEIDSKIEGFGFQRDPRIDEILSGRNKKKDLAVIFHFKEEEISLTEEEALKGGIKFHYGNIELPTLTNANGIKLPETVHGNVYLHSLTNAKGLKLPKTIHGSLYLDGLTSAEGLKLPKTIRDDLYLRGLTGAEGLELPETLSRSLYLSNLKSAKGLGKIPATISGNLDLRNLARADGLKLPENLNANLLLNGLKSARGLKLPKTIRGCLALDSLTSAEGVKLPASIDGVLSLNSLTSAEGLKLPKGIRANLDFRSLISANGLELPVNLNGSLLLSSLTNAEGLKLPKTIHGSIDLSSLKSIEGLVFPKSITGQIHLSQKIPRSELIRLSEDLLTKITYKYTNQ